MDATIVGLFNGMGVGTFIVLIIAIGVILKGAYNWVEKYRKARNEIEDKDKQIDNLSNSVTQINASMHAQNQALRVMLMSELDKKYNNYIELQYIPNGEYDDYVDLHDAYKGIGGNHNGDSKFGYVMKHLERK